MGTDDAEGKVLSQRAMDLTFEEAYGKGEEGFSRLLAVYFRKKKDAHLRKMVRHIHTAARIEPDYRSTLEKVAAGEEDLFDQACVMLAEEYRRRARRFLVQLEGLREKVSGAPESAREYYGAIWDVANALSSASDIFAMREVCASHSFKKPRKSAKMAPETAELLSVLQELATRLKSSIFKSIKEFDTHEAELARHMSAKEQARTLAALTCAYDDNFTAVKREAGVLDYGDLEQYALKLIGMSEVKDSIHAKYKFVFVDEYQDVNPMQERILLEIAREDVFLVGDKKQAIYGFRGSNSKYFTKKVEEFKREGNSLELNENFRSANAILNATNAVFSAALEGYVPMAGGALYHNYHGEVHVHNLPKEKEKSVERTVYSVREAAANPAENAIARKVASIVEAECGKKEGWGKKWFDVDIKTVDEQGMSVKGGFRPVRYGDIAVLVRKNTKSAGPIVRALSERGIPVTTSAEVNVCDFFEVRLLIDWLSYLDNAEQDIPMASAMLSVIGGFTDAELARIRLKVEKTLRRHGLSFRAACRAYVQGYREGNDPLCKKLERFFEFSARYRALAQVRTASEMIMLLLAEGLEAQIAAKGASKSRLARVRRFVTESTGCNTVHEFLRRLKDSEYNVEFSEAGGENAVHVITMHSAKGLEFPVVILVELDGDFTRNATIFNPEIDEVRWTNAFHIAPRYFDLERKVYQDTVIRRAAALFARREALEGERNLLYVAMTRAYCRLHMIFEDGWECPESEEEEARFYAPDDAKRLSDFVPRMRLPSSAPFEEEVRERKEKRALDYVADDAIVKKIVHAGTPYPYFASTLVPVKDSATGLMKKIRNSVYESKGMEEEHTMSEIEAEVSDTGGAFTAETGVAYHAFLEHVRFGEDAEEELCRMQKEQLLSDKQIALLDIERLKSILAMPVFSGLEGKKTWREQRFLVKFPACEFAEAYGQTAAQDEIVFQGAIDLLIEEGEGRYTVVDYKFSSLSDCEIRRKYAIQMKLYKKTVAKVMECAESFVRVRIVNIARISELEI